MRFSGVGCHRDPDVALSRALTEAAQSRLALIVGTRDGLSDHCQGVTVLGGGAYLNRGLIIPHRKRPHRELLPGEEADNAAHRKARAGGACGRPVEELQDPPRLPTAPRGLHQASRPSPRCTTSPSHHDEKAAVTHPGLPKHSLVQHPLKAVPYGV